MALVTDNESIGIIGPGGWRQTRLSPTGSDPEGSSPNE